MTTDARATEWGVIRPMMKVKARGVPMVAFAALYDGFWLVAPLVEKGMSAVLQAVHERELRPDT